MLKNSLCTVFSTVAVSGIISVFNQPAYSSSFILDVEADAVVRTDQTIRRDENYGKINANLLGSGRGGGGIPFGGADAIRSLLRFDLSGQTTPARKATLELTINNIPNRTDSTIFEVGVYRVLEPWIEGNGCEAPFSTTFGCPVNSVFPDKPEAFGVAWEGNPPNTETQPAFDPTKIAFTLIDPNTAFFGDIVQLDLTSLYNSWITGTPNVGILLRDTIPDRGFKEIAFGSKDPLDPLLDGFNNAPAPRLVLELDDNQSVPEPFSTFSLLSITIGSMALKLKIKKSGNLPT